MYAISFVATAIALLAVSLMGGTDALLTVVVLGALEATFSFDNAVVNAKILQHMPLVWQAMFLTVGVLIAVFGVRLLLPIALVAATAGLSMDDVVRLALQRPGEYAQYLTLAHPLIAGFGGMFLLMIFLEFMLDAERHVHWLRAVERPLTRVGRTRLLSLLAALVALGATVLLLAGAHRLGVLLAGALGLAAYVAIRWLVWIFERRQERLARQAVVNKLFGAGLLSFLYLELLDASFSLDSVIGAFAITNQIVLIAVGLGVGALWMRSMTVHIVRRHALRRYRYLDHGAHYAMGALAVLLLLSIRYHIHEAVTGSAGLIIIGFALYSSWRYNQAHEPVAAG